MKTDLSNAECCGALELLREPSTRASPFVRLGCRNTQHIRGVDHNVLRFHTGLLECFPEPLHAIRIDRAFVAVEFWDCGKNLYGLHARIRRAMHRHLDTAIVDWMRAEDVGH